MFFLKIFFLCDVCCSPRCSHVSRSIALHIVLLMTYDYDFLVLRTNFEGDKSEIVLRRVAASMIFSLDAVERCSSSVTQNFRAFSSISIFVFAVATVTACRSHTKEIRYRIPKEAESF